MTEGEPDLSIPFLGLRLGCQPCLRPRLRRRPGPRSGLASRLCDHGCSPSEPAGRIHLRGPRPRPQPDTYVGLSDVGAGPSAIRPVTGPLSRRSITYTYQDSVGNTVRQYSYKNTRKSLMTTTAAASPRVTSIGDPYFDGWRLVRAPPPPEGR